MRVRWFGKIVVVGIGPHAAGEPIPLESSLAAVCAGNRGVVVDLVGCRLVTSKILNDLIFAERAAKPSGNRLRVCCPEGFGSYVIGEFKLDKVFWIFRTLAEALESFGPASSKE